MAQVGQGYEVHHVPFDRNKKIYKSHIVPFAQALTVSEILIFQHVGLDNLVRDHREQPSQGSFDGKLQSL